VGQYFLSPFLSYLLDPPLSQPPNHPNHARAPKQAHPATADQTTNPTHQPTGSIRKHPLFVSKKTDDDPKPRGPKKNEKGFCGLFNVSQLDVIAAPPLEHPAQK
jgi:hypothetical protein